MAAASYNTILDSYIAELTRGWRKLNPYELTKAGDCYINHAGLLTEFGPIGFAVQPHHELYRRIEPVEQKPTLKESIRRDKERSPTVMQGHNKGCTCVTCDRDRVWEAAEAWDNYVKLTQTEDSQDVSEAREDAVHAGGSPAADRCDKESDCCGGEATQAGSSGHTECQRDDEADASGPQIRAQGTDQEARPVLTDPQEPCPLEGYVILTNCRNLEGEPVWNKRLRKWEYDLGFGMMLPCGDHTHVAKKYEDYHGPDGEDGPWAEGWAERSGEPKTERREIWVPDYAGFLGSACGSEEDCKLVSGGQGTCRKFREVFPDDPDIDELRDYLEKMIANCDSLAKENAELEQSVKAYKKRVDELGDLLHSKDIEAADLRKQRDEQQSLVATYKTRDKVQAAIKKRVKAADEVADLLNDLSPLVNMDHLPHFSLAKIAAKLRGES